MKTMISLLAIFVLAGLIVLAGDSPPTSDQPPELFKPTWKGDDHDPPVYTSPTNDAPAFIRPPDTNTLPAITNWSGTNMPPMTNWPTSRIPENAPPSLQTHGGH